MRAPSWVSTRRSLQRNLRNLPSLPTFSHLAPFYALALKSGLHQDLLLFPLLLSAVLHACDATISRHSYASSIFRHLHRSSAVSVHISAISSLLSGAAAAPSSAAAGASVHGVALKLGVLACTIFANSLLSFFSKSVLLSHARHLFDEIPFPDLVSRNTMLAAYARTGSMVAAMKLVDEMPERDVVSWTTIVAGFTRAGDMAAARVTFDAMPVRNTVSWMVMLSGYAVRGLLREAMDLFEKMENLGVELEDGAVVNILSSCGESGLLLLGERVHHWVERRLMGCGTEVWNAILDMYFKCGDISNAVRVFKMMGRRNLVSWNVLILGLASNGYGREVVSLLSEMEMGGFQPDKVTFIGVLCGCAHAGLVDEGVHYLRSMHDRYGVRPEIEHYGCIVDLLGRRGLLEEAFELVYRMPFEPNYVIWNTLLRSCRVHNAERLAGVAWGNSKRARSSNDGTFLVSSDIETTKERRREGREDEKMFGSSSIEVDWKVHIFRSFDVLVCPNLEAMVCGLNQYVNMVGNCRVFNGCNPGV